MFYAQTNPDALRRMVVAIMLMGSLTSIGCDSHSRPRQTADAPSETPAVPDPYPKLSPPVPSRLAFDELSRTLTTYDLPDRSARWMVLMPSEPRGLPLQRVHTLPKGVSPQEVIVFYSIPGRGTSHAISLADVIQSQQLQAQR